MDLANGLNTRIKMLVLRLFLSHLSDPLAMPMAKIVSNIGHARIDTGIDSTVSMGRQRLVLLQQAGFPLV